MKIVGRGCVGGECSRQTLPTSFTGVVRVGGGVG